MSSATLWMVIAVALPVVAGILAPMPTADLAYHLRAGDLMLASGEALRADPFTFTAAGQPWLDQQWGAQILLALEFDAVGWAGMAVVRAMAIGAIMVAALAATRLAGASPRQAALLTLAAFVVGARSLSLRPQLFGLVLLAVVIVLVVGRSRRPWLPWLVPPLALIWANVHGTFVLAPALVALAWLDDATAGRPHASRLLAVLALTILATFVTPWGPQVWTYAASLSIDPIIRELVVEWQWSSPTSLPGALLWASILAAAVAVAVSPLSIRWPWLLWLGGLATLAITAQRAAVLWAVGAPAFLVPAIQAGLERIQDRRSRRRTDASGSPGGRAIPPPERRSLNAAFAIAFILVGIVAYPGWRGDDPVYGPPGLLEDAPPGVTEALRDVADPSDRLFNAQRWGSWLEWAVPDVPLFIDSRIEALPDQILDDYIAISDGASDWRQLLNDWGVTILALESGQQDVLIEAIDGDPAWRPILEDEEGVVLVRADRP